MSNWMSTLEEFRQKGTPTVMVTVTQCTGSTPREPGAKMLVTSEGLMWGTIGGGHLEECALQDARRCLNEGKTQTIRYPLGAKTGQCCGGVVELLFEVLNTGPHLYLFGAGHVGQAVCKVMVGTPFLVHLIDDRKEWIRQESIPKEVICHECEWDEFVEQAKWDPEKTYVAIMTYRHDVDQEIVKNLVCRQMRYLGLIGSQSKWERFKQRLQLQGISESEFAKVRCPLGLPIGGKSPQEVAISLASELLQNYYGK